MGGILLCRTHGRQGPRGTSARLAEALRLGQPIPADWVSLVVVTSRLSRTQWYLIDSEAVSAAGLDPADGPFVLEDRDVEARQLHDRLLIVKLLPSDLVHPRICKLCLAEAVTPQGTPRLQLPDEFKGQSLL